MSATIVQEQRPYTVVDATNWFLDPEFDQGQLGVNASNAGTFAQVLDGSDSYQSCVATSAAIAGMRLHPNNKRAPASPGQTWYAAVPFKNVNAGSRTFVLEIRFYDVDATSAAAGTTLAMVQSSTVTIAAGATTELLVSGVAPAGTLSVGIVAYRGTAGAANGDIIRCQRAMLSTDNTTFFYGFTPPSATYRYDFLNGPGSRSIRYVRSPLTAPLTPTFVPGEGYTFERESGTTVHRLLDGGIAVTLGPAGPRRGTLTYLFDSQTEADRAHAMHANPSAFTLTESTRFGTLKYVVEDTFEMDLVEDASKDLFVLTVPFCEVP